MAERLQDGSVVVGVVRQALGRLQSAVETSRVCRLLPSVCEGLSRLRSSSDETMGSTTSGGQLGRWGSAVGAQSRLWSLARRLSRQGSTAMASARSTTVLGHLTDVATDSFVYRWLTAEPDPDVIVIDLRETWTAGPIINTIDRTLRELLPAVPTATIAGVGRRLVAFGRHRPLKVLSLVVLAGVCGSFVGGIFLGAITWPVVGLLFGLTVIAGFGLRSRRTLEELRATRSVRLLVAAFEPPAPPADLDSGPESKSHSEPKSDHQGSSATQPTETPPQPAIDDDSDGESPN